MSAVAVGYLDGKTFAEKLERAIARSDRAKLIEARAYTLRISKIIRSLFVAARRGFLPRRTMSYVRR